MDKKEVEISLQVIGRALEALSQNYPVQAYEHLKPLYGRLLFLLDDPAHPATV